MMPFGNFFSPARRSMEPLLGDNDKEKDAYPRTGSPVTSRSQTGHPSMLGRRKLILVGVFLIVLSGIVLLGGGGAGAGAGQGKTTTLLSSIRLGRRNGKMYSIHLKTVQEPYMAVKDPQRRYTWSKEAFLPNTQISAQYVNNSMFEPAGPKKTIIPEVKEHTISLNPREVRLDELAEYVKPEEIVFGFTSPYRRARDMCSTWKHFLQHGSQCLIVLPREEQPYEREMQFYLAKEGLGHCRVTTVDLGQYQRYEHRVLNMPRAMMEQSWTDSKGEAVIPKWYVVVDDDSQILDMRTLQREMGARPSKEEHLLCAVTESVTQIGRHGKICYGGGGVVMSAGLVTKMTERMFDCFWMHHWRFGGDEMLTHCASTATGIPVEKVFTDVIGLHQVDIPGDGSGPFQSGIPFITLHHYTGWLEVFPLWFCPNRMEAMRRLQKSAEFLGGDNLFKRFVFDEGRTVMTLGYSITLYSQPLKEYEMRLMERTYRNWEHELRWPARPLIPEGAAKGRYKVSYFLKAIKEKEKVMLYENSRGDIIRVQIDL